MKIGILSDIHGNSYALEAVLARCREEKINQLLILGDIVGYYYYPDRVLQMLGGYQISIIRGNHEILLKKLLDGSVDSDEIRKKYGSGTLFAARSLTQHQLSELINLPDSLSVTIDGLSFGLYHGSPWDPNYYIYPNASNDELDKCIPDLNLDFLLLGHTHYSFLSIRGKTLIINPGSVGQPRDEAVGASWAIIDTSNKSVVFKQTPYDKTQLLKDVEKFDDDVPYLKQVLLRK
jgi:putative phosphoesterase